jgi:alkaline phosphatase D
MKIALASCQRFDTGHYAAWRHAAQQPLDLVIFVGDYIYEYPTRPGAIRPVGGRVETLDDFRNRYAVHRSDPSLQAAHAMHPWLVIWDDHEVDNDYASLTGQSLQPDFARYRADAYRAWWEHMPVPKTWRPRSGFMRIYDRFDWGRLATIHLLDTRQYRDLQACPRPGRAGSNSVTLSDCPELTDSRRSLLGTEQERWLAAGLQPDRRWNLIAQTTLMARSAFGPPGNERHWTDGWDGYPAARARLLESIRDRRVPGTLVLGGDIHTHAVADLRLNFDDSQSAILATEFCCTSISSLGPPQTRINASREANPHIRYARSDRRGYIELSIDHREARADLISVDDSADPMSACRVDARFSVDADRPGAHAA